MRTPDQWHHEAHVAAHSDDALTVDNFIREVQREAFEAGARAMRLAIKSLLSGFDRATVDAIDIEKLRDQS